jgi:hypothetical protein
MSPRSGVFDGQQRCRDFGTGAGDDGFLKTLVEATGGPVCRALAVIKQVHDCMLTPTLNIGQLAHSVSGYLQINGLLNRLSLPFSKSNINIQIWQT